MKRATAGLVIIGLASGVTLLSAQAGRGPAPAPPPTVLNLGAFVISVQNLESSLAFYRGGPGLDVVMPPATPALDTARNTVMGTTGGR